LVELDTFGAYRNLQAGQRMGLAFVACNHLVERMVQLAFVAFALEQHIQ